MFAVNRYEFMAWADGIYMDRKADGSVIAPEDAICQRAKELLDQGQTVHFTVHGEIVSTIKKVGDRYVEQLIDGDLPCK